MNFAYTKKLNKLALLLFSVTSCFIAAALMLSTQKAGAAYDGGRIIDDAVFLDSSAMSRSQIQNFLEAKNSGLADMEFELMCYGADSTERQLYENAGAECDTEIPASHIIYYAAKIYGLNPQAILSTLQKEQSLVTAQNPTTWQLTQAMGYACPTSGSCSSSSSFPYQIDSGVWALRWHYERANGNNSWWRESSSWTCGTEKNYYKPNLYPGQNVKFYDQDGVHYRTHFIDNAATSSLYCYTPHAYNNPDGLYGREPYGTKGRYYSGSYNFVLFFEQWFGGTKSSETYKPMSQPRWMYLKSDLKKLNPATGVEVDSTLPQGLEVYFTDKITVDGKMYLRTKHDTDNYLGKAIPESQLQTVSVDYGNMKTPRWMETTEDTQKIDPLTREKVGGILPKGTQLYFPSKTTVGGSVYLRTEADSFSDGVRTGINIASLKTSSVGYVPLEKPRWFVSSVDTKIFNIKYPKSTNESESIGQDAGLYLGYKIKINDRWYLVKDLPPVGEWIGTPIEHLKEVEDSDFSSLKYQRAYETTGDTKKISLSSTAPPLTSDQILAGTQIFFESKIYLDGKLYLRTSHDTNEGELKIVDAETLVPVEVTFEAMEMPRRLVTTKLIRKRDPVTLHRVSTHISKGISIDFSEKISINGKLYLRTKHDQENGHYRVVEYNHLEEE